MAQDAEAGWRRCGSLSAIPGIRVELTRCRKTRIESMDSLRLFAALVFAVSVFLLFDAWNKERNPAPPVLDQAAQRADSTTPSPTLPPQAGTPASGASPAAPNAVATANMPPIIVRTDVLIAEIDPVGGSLRRLEFTQHKEKLDKTKNFVLFQKDASHTYIQQSGLIGNELPNHTTTYTSSNTAYELKDGIDMVVVPLDRKSVV